MKINLLFSCLFFILCISSCSKEKGIAEILYNNPSVDSIKFAYRIETLTYIQPNISQDQTELSFTIDTGNLYAWSSIKISYPNGNAKIYFPEYSLGQINKLVDQSVSQENIEIDYFQAPPNFTPLVSTIKYYRIENAFALKFYYDSAKLVGIDKLYLDRDAGTLGAVIESARFCKGFNIGECIDISSNYTYQYSQSYNNLYLSAEMLPIILCLIKPNQVNLDDISSDFPLLFSRNYPTAYNSPISGQYEYGLTGKQEPSYFYFKRLNSTYPEGYLFSLR